MQSTAHVLRGRQTARLKVSSKHYFNVITVEYFPVDYKNKQDCPMNFLVTKIILYKTWSFYKEHTQETTFFVTLS